MTKTVFILFFLRGSYYNLRDIAGSFRNLRHKSSTVTQFSAVSQVTRCRLLIEKRVFLAKSNLVDCKPEKEIRASPKHEALFLSLLWKSVILRNQFKLWTTWRILLPVDDVGKVFVRRMYNANINRSEQGCFNLLGLSKFIFLLISIELSYLQRRLGDWNVQVRHTGLEILFYELASHDFILSVSNIFHFFSYSY